MCLPRRFWRKYLVFPNLQAPPDPAQYSYGKYSLWLIIWEPTSRDTFSHFRGWRINLAFCPADRQLHLLSADPFFPPRWLMAAFLYLDFTLGPAGSSWWLSGKSDQFGKWVAAPVNSHLNPGPSIAGAVTLIFSHVTTVIVKQLLKRSWNNTWESRHIQFSSEVLQVQWRSSEVSDCRTH